MNKELEKIKQAFRITWKYHKGSTFVYLYALGVMLFLAYLGAQAIRLKVALPDYLLTGFVGIIMGYIGYNALSKLGDMMYETEKKKIDSCNQSGESK